jgi:hypothetical protein
MTSKQQSKGETKHKHFRIKPIGFIRSDLKRREEAPRQGREGAPNALIEVLPSLRESPAPNASRGRNHYHQLAASRSEKRNGSSSERRCIATAHGSILDSITRSSQSHRASSREGFRNRTRSFTCWSNRGDRWNAGNRYKTSGRNKRLLNPTNRYKRGLITARAKAKVCKDRITSDQR